MSVPELSADEMAVVARFGIHRESCRVVVACINWNWPREVAPHAMSYVLRDGLATAEQFHSTWADAMGRADRLAQKWVSGASGSILGGENGSGVVGTGVPTSTPQTGAQRGTGIQRKDNQ